MIKPNSFSKDFLGEVPQEFYGQKRPSRPSRGPGRPGVGDRHAVLGVNLGDFGPVRASVPIFLTVAWHHRGFTDSSITPSGVSKPGCFVDPKHSPFWVLSFFLSSAYPRLPGLPGDHLTPLIDSTSHSFN